jgi:hypothetical protein
MHASSVVVKITAWYDWLLVVLVLVLGAYTCKCLDYCLSIGVQHSLSIQAKEIAGRFAVTGQIPGRQGSSEPGFNDQFVSVRARGASMPVSTGKPENHLVIPSKPPLEPNSPDVPTSAVRWTAHDARFLIATAPSTFGNREYVVAVGSPRQPIKTIFRQSAILLLGGLVVWLAIATLGSFFLVKHALVPIQKIALAVQAFPVALAQKKGIQGIPVLDEIETLCAYVNEMVGQVESSFRIGTGLPAEALDAPNTRLGAVRGELANLLEHERLSNGIAPTLLCLLKETERLSEISRNLATPSCEESKHIRTERLKFYLGGLAASGTERVCLLTKKLGADLVSEARDPSNGDYSAQW